VSNSDRVVEQAARRLLFGGELKLTYLVAARSEA
jgi:hypothetical protein